MKVQNQNLKLLPKVQSDFLKRNFEINPKFKVCPLIGRFTEHGFLQKPWPRNLEKYANQIWIFWLWVLDQTTICTNAGVCIRMLLRFCHEKKNSWKQIAVVCFRVVILNPSFWCFYIQLVYRVTLPCTSWSFSLFWTKQVYLQGISEQSVKCNSALVRILIYIFPNIRDPMCPWETPIFDT